MVSKTGQISQITFSHVLFSPGSWFGAYLLLSRAKKYQYYERTVKLAHMPTKEHR